MQTTSTRTAAIYIRLTPEELAEAKQAAHDAGEQVSEFVRQAIHRRISYIRGTQEVWIAPLETPVPEPHEQPAAPWKRVIPAR